MKRNPAQIARGPKKSKLTFSNHKFIKPLREVLTVRIQGTNSAFKQKPIKKDREEVGEANDKEMIGLPPPSVMRIGPTSADGP